MKTFKFTYAILLTVALAAVVHLESCISKTAREPDGKLMVVTTTGMIKDAVENVAGDKANVIALMGPGVDPHLYKATHGDLQKITDADIVFYNGLHLEGKMGKVLEKAEKLKPVVAVSANMKNSSLRTIPGYDNTHDPHIWFDVSLWRQAVIKITKVLQEQDSANAATYEVNSKIYLAKLDSLHEAVKNSLSVIPPSQRVLITAHDAFGYFGDAYNIEVRGLQGISTLSEFGLKDVTLLVDFIIERKIKAIFVETSVSARSIEAILEGCREKGWNVSIGGSLYSDAMGKKNTPEGTYIGMVSANVNKIVNALK
jgi:manganese/zinc/iron transport system substrate-binding protein